MAKKGLGDRVESVIKAVAPKLHKKKENCNSCKRRKAILNKMKI